MKRHPLTVVGGGIAGLSLGIGLRRTGLPVTVIEASTYPRHRVCGEFISGVSAAALTRLGVADLLEDAEICRETVWYDKSGPVLRKVLPNPALGISRHRLDQRMANRFCELGGELREGERFRDLETPQEGHIFATGRPREHSSQWLGLKGHLLDYSLAADLEMHLGDGGYIGLSRIENGRVNACGLFQLRSDLKIGGGEALIAYLHACGLEKLAHRISCSSLDPESLVGVSAFQFGRQRIGKSEEVSLGDRSSIIGPFTGHGMSMAFESAAIMMPLLTEFSIGNCSWKTVVRENNRCLKHSFHRRMAVSRLVHPFLISSSGQKVLLNLAKRDWLPFSLIFRATR